MTRNPAQTLTKSWSAIKSIGFGVKAVLEEKLRFRDVMQKSTSKRTDSLSSMETVAVSNVIGGSQLFDCDREMEKQITAKTKSENEQLKEMMDRCFERWDNGKSKNVADLEANQFRKLPAVSQKMMYCFVTTVF